MVVMVFRTSLENEILPWIEQEQLSYTRLDSVQGKGSTGPVPDSVTWGGSNTVLLLALPDDRLNRFRDRLREFDARLEAWRQTEGTPFHVFVLPCLQWL